MYKRWVFKYNYYYLFNNNNNNSKSIMNSSYYDDLLLLLTVKEPHNSDAYVDSTARKLTRF